MKTDRITHAPGCWSWGPRHYECAVGQIERDEALLRQALEVLSRAHQSAATKGKPRPWKHRPTKRAVAEPRLNRRGE